MIVVSEKHFLVLIPNTMTLEKYGNYFYVEKSLYDKLILLENTYDFERIGILLEKENNLETIEWLKDLVPSPLTAIVPFLRLVKQEILKDLESCIGALHTIFCTGLDPYGFIRTDASIRRTIEFGRTDNLYKDMWTGIMKQYVDHEEVMNLLQNPVQHVTYKEDLPMEVIEKVGDFQVISEDEIYVEDDPLGANMSDAEIDAWLKEEEEANKLKETSAVETKAVNTNTEKEPTTGGNDEMAELMKVLSGQ